MKTLSLDMSNFFGYLLPSLQHTPCIQDIFFLVTCIILMVTEQQRDYKFFLLLVVAVVAVVAEFAASRLAYESAEEEPKNVY